MAYDKVIDSAKLDSAMGATADAIRAKTGSTATIAWDETSGFSSAVSAIEAGGGGEEYAALAQALLKHKSFTLVCETDVNTGVNALQYSPITVCDAYIGRIDRGFCNYSSLHTLVLRNTSATELKSTSAFIGTPFIGSGLYWESGDAPTGYLYVPDDLVSEYASDSNWCTIASDTEGEAPVLILPLSEYEG